MTEGLCALTATEAVARLKAGEVTAAELVEASIARIEEVDPKVNALPIPCFDRARDMARDMDMAVIEPCISSAQRIRGGSSRS